MYCKYCIADIGPERVAVVAYMYVSFYYNKSNVDALQHYVARPIGEGGWGQKLRKLWLYANDHASGLNNSKFVSIQVVSHAVMHPVYGTRTKTNGWIIIFFYYFPLEIL